MFNFAQIPSPDSNENPLCFFFKNIKIEMNSRNKLQISPIVENDIMKK